MQEVVQNTGVEIEDDAVVEQLGTPKKGNARYVVGQDDVGRNYLCNNQEFLEKPGPEHPCGEGVVVPVVGKVCRYPCFVPHVEPVII